VAVIAFMWEAKLGKGRHRKCNTLYTRPPYS
jgi:hypothetical protein